MGNGEDSEVEGDEFFSEFNHISIGLMDPDRVLEMSHGEIEKPETINYRTLRPERGGLFCEKIFGPTRDWECFCGKYKSKKYAGVVCDKCGVEVARSKVRRVRMGHINLMSPVAHIWFLKGIPSKISLVLDMKIKNLEKVVYYESYVVLDPGETELHEKELLSEQEYQRAREEYGNRFKADMGAAAIQELLEEMDLEAEIEAIEEELELSKKGKRAKLGQKNKNLIRRLRTLKGFYDSGIEPSNMISEVVPVIPPELRPMIQLERGRFATSDVNDLYRRVINRNNRLKKLQELRTPDIIIRNEKRMLQEAVDALIDNSRVDRPVRGPNNRPLKSLTDLLKGKQGRFRQNLLGKRVDYSGRAVIVNGPELNFNQCGLPKKMAVELFKPFIMQRLVNDDEAASIKSAKRMIEREESEVWDALEEVIQGHPVMLNRAPTLHRLGIQAYQPVLTEGHAIQLHPLQCPPFNADYDGDQMAVHIPLSKTAQIEARVLMMSTNNLLSPAHGGALSIPTQDMVIGLHYLTKTKAHTDLDEIDPEDVEHVFGNSKHVEWALESDAVDLAEPIIFRDDGKQYVTTPGRVMFNDVLPEEMAFQNESYDEDGLADLVRKSVEDHGIYDTVQMLDRLKKLGYHESTLMGCSISYEDLLKPERKEELLEEGEQRVEEITDQYEAGNIVEEEKYNRVINVWHEITEEVSNDVFDTMSKDMEGYNPVYMMADSGARGSGEQIRQLAGMRGLMAKPSGKIIELPIKSSFRDGLSVMEYFISTHGARKGLADTALKTADAGYLTRRLADVAQSVRITDSDCGTLNGLEVSPIRDEEQILESIEDRIIGRVAREDIKHPQTGEVIVEENDEIDEEAGRRIGDCGFDSVEIRSVLTCEAEDGVCAKCYGRDLSTRKIVDIGEPVGIIAAQSIGEPGTQLTMRTFHTGGTAAGGGEEGIFAENDIYVEEAPEDAVEYTTEDGEETLVALTESELRLRKVNQTLELEPDEDDVELEPVAFDGLWVYDGDAIATRTVDGEEEEITADHEGIVNIKDDTLYVLGNEYTIDVGIGASILYDEGEIIESGAKYVEIDPYNELIVAEFDGTANLRDIEVGRTLSEEVDEATGMINKVITEDKQGNLFPNIVLKKEGQKSTRRYDLPYNSILEVDDGEEVQAGQILAKMPRESVQTKDITGGLPRVEDLFEARKRTKESAKVAEISGEVDFIKEEKRQEKGVRTIEITNPETDDTKSYRVKPGVHIRVREGERIEEGTPLTEGYINPHDLLRVRGVSSLQDYLVEEIQKVYLQQGITIDDKHIEVVVRQMLRRVMITESGDTGFLPGERADRYRLARINEEIQSDGGEPATFKPILQGITKASLETDSFISAASFQDTKRVLSDAACKGQIDELEGLKENVITGHLIPAGTGFESYREMFKKDLRDVVEQARSFTREAAEEEEDEADEAEEAEEVPAS